MKFKHLLAGFLFLLSLGWYGYIGLYHTLYGIGIYLIPAVLFLALLLWLIFALILGAGWRKSVLIPLYSAFLMYTGLITQHYLSRYKPLVKVHIPSGFEGCIYFIHSNDIIKSDLTPDEHGVVYIPYSDDYRLKARWNGKKAEYVLNTERANQVVYYNRDSTIIRWTDVSCWEIGEDIDYQNIAYVPKELYPCLDPLAFREMMHLNQLDSSRIKWFVYDYTSQSYINN